MAISALPRVFGCGGHYLADLAVLPGCWRAHPPPYTLHTTHYTLHPTLYTLHPEP